MTAFLDLVARSGFVAAVFTLLGVGIADAIAAHHRGQQ